MRKQEEMEVSAQELSSTIERINSSLLICDAFASIHSTEIILFPHVVDIICVFIIVFFLP